MAAGPCEVHAATGSVSGLACCPQCLSSSCARGTIQPATGTHSCLQHRAGLSVAPASLGAPLRGTNQESSGYSDLRAA